MSLVYMDYVNSFFVFGFHDLFLKGRNGVKKENQIFLVSTKGCKESI